jgi:hypothetical protein
MPFSGKAGKLNKQLAPAPQQRALSHIPCSAALVCENQIQTTPQPQILQISLSVIQIHPKPQDFCVHRRNSKEHDSRSHSHINTGLPEFFSTKGGLLEQVCMCTRAVLSSSDNVIPLIVGVTRQAGQEASTVHTAPICFSPFQKCCLIPHTAVQWREMGCQKFLTK